MTPFLADFIGQPDLAAEVDVDQRSTPNAPDAVANVDRASLSAEQRHSLKWVYAVFMVFSWLALLPMAMLLPYYYIFIMQRVNQDLRMALLERWLGLSLRYHSDHRVGDSVYRIYQDSAQVTAVVGTVTQAMQLLSTYAIGIVFPSRARSHPRLDGAWHGLVRNRVGALVLAAHARQILGIQTRHVGFHVARARDVCSAAHHQSLRCRRD